MTLLLKSGSLLGAAVRHEKGRRDANRGIESGHCYAVLSVKDIDLVALGQVSFGFCRSLVWVSCDAVLVGWGSCIGLF